jgi:hypothetical protein
MAKKKSKGTSHGTTLGAAYRAASTGVILASRAVVTGGTDVQAYADAYRAEGKDIALGLAVHAVDQVAGQRLVQHNSALGRGSLTAILPEAFAVMQGVSTGTSQGGVSAFSRAKSGYSPGGGFAIDDSTKMYLLLKYGGGLARKALAAKGIAPVARPIKKLLSGMGVTV